MINFKEDILIFILTLVNFMFLFSIAVQCYLIYYVSYKIPIIYGIISFGIYLIFKYLIKKRKYKITFSTIILLVISIFFYNNRTIILNRIISDFNILNRDIYEGVVTSFYTYQMILLILIPLFLLVFFLWNKKVYYFLPTLILSGMLYFWYTGYTEIIIKNSFDYVFITIFTVIIINYIINISNFRKREINIKTSFISIVIYSAILGVFLSTSIKVLPKDFFGNISSKSYSYFENKWSKVRINEGVLKIYNISYSGYSDSDKNLGGPINIDNNKVMDVYGDKFLYLRGSAKDYYTGYSWKVENKTYEEKSKEILDSQNNNMVEIKNIKIDTSTLFSPNLAFNIIPDKGRVFKDNYSCFFRDKNYDSNYKVYYNDKIKMLEEFYDIRVFSPNKKEFITGTNYLQLPDTIPKEVYDLVEKIINAQGEELSDYNKVGLLKKYLEKNYEYSLEPKETPTGEDFVYNFLFNEKKGYCTYFATSLVVMCRIANIPAIYVEGFKQGDGPEIKNSMAHAWVEVNITNDSNWLIVDPSPSAYEDANKKINTEDPEVIDPENNQSTGNGENNKPKKEEEIEGEGGIKTKKEINMGILLIGIFLLLLFLKVIYVFILKIRITNSEKISPLLKYSFKRLKSIKLNVQRYEGLVEFSKGIKDEELRKIMLEISECYYKEEYGDISSDYFDKKKFYIDLEDIIKYKKGRARYYLEKWA